MRQWLVNPKIMCRKHLLGEHVEHHMFVGTIQRKKKLQGYFDHNCLEPLSLTTRHEELVKEMESRGMNHQSPLQEFTLDYLGQLIYNKIDKAKAQKDLLSRCKECRARLEILNKGA